MNDVGRPQQEARPAPAGGPTLDVESRESRRRRNRLLIAAGAIAAVIVVGVALLAPRSSTLPSLTVFEREPTDQEREAERRFGEQGGFWLPGSEWQGRMILDIPATDEVAARHVWALRAEAGEPPGEPYVLICLAVGTTETFGDLLSCMDEVDMARRGFIPLDQPRPTVLVGDEQLMIAWGPTGDARLVDPPTPPARSDPSS